MILIRSMLVLAGLFILPACSTSQLQNFQAGLANISAGVAAVDQTIAQVSPTLAKYCGDAQAVGAQLADVTNSSSSAGAGLAGVNAGIVAWCQSPPTDIKSAVASIAAVVNAGRAAYTAARKGN